MKTRSTELPVGSSARTSDTRLSTAIAIARLIGIMGIVYVHAWTGRTAEELAAEAFSWQAVLRTVLGEVFGRSAVPLLGMISGWLVVSTATRQGYAAFVLGKARTILLPMVLWNAIAIVLVGAAATFGDLKAPTPTSIGWTLNEPVPLVQANDVNVQMPFLRDLFVCMVIAPGLVRASNAWLALVASIVVVWSVSGVHVPPLLRPQILLFFTAGVAVRRFGLAERAAGWPIALCGLPFVVLIAPRLWTALLGNAFFDAYPHLMAAFDIVFRLASAVLFWRLGWEQCCGPIARDRALRVSRILRSSGAAVAVRAGDRIGDWRAGGGILSRISAGPAAAGARRHGRAGASADGALADRRAGAQWRAAGAIGFNYRVTADRVGSPIPGYGRR
ncbi:acyltransferase family protein [Sphingomonas sp. Leaf208]|uniref:acyltransferase family protein n=1 Tax=Sphingomonas sp. Leaf208 TaxID=1735679 RepID=UPI001F16DF2B|nr:acyltransferase [Sphingomonas sp. Leaf208]